MELKPIIGASLVVALLGLGALAGSVAGTGAAAAQVVATPTARAASPEQTKPAPNAPAPQAAITQQQAEASALTASPGNTVDHTRLGQEKGVAAYDVDFTN